MRSIKRDLIGLGAICALVLAFALAWGGPTEVAGAATAQTQQQQQQQPDQAQPQPQQQPDQAQPQPQEQPGQGQAPAASTFTGTVVKNGEQYMLRDSSGQVFGLDDSSKAQPFEGKTVKVTGELDQQAKVIHVENIESAEA
jgi:hemolysin activation/secretion protein